MRRACQRDVVFAAAPPLSATDEAVQAALAYELAGRTLALTPSARAVTIDVFEQAQDVVTGQPVSPCTASDLHPENQSTFNVMVVPGKGNVAVPPDDPRGGGRPHGRD